LVRLVRQFLAKKARGLGLLCLAHDKFPNEEEAGRLGVELGTFDAVLNQSDYISINLPILPETRHIICRDSIAKMKDGVLLINTARGGLVDEKAVCLGLASGKLGGMAADVFETEPVPEDCPLFKFGNYLCTPHYALRPACDFRSFSRTFSNSGRNNSQSTARFKTTDGSPFESIFAKRNSTSNKPLNMSPPPHGP
jgi:hypothetical protein